MALRIAEIANVLERYKDRYLWLDVFASEVLELTERTSQVFRETGKDTYQTIARGQAIQVMLDRSRNLARFRLLPEKDVLEKAILGAATGVLVSTLMPSLRSPTGIVLGLLVGGFVGASFASPARERIVDENRILTLSYDPEKELWEVYHGPYRDFAKVALHPKAA